MNYPVGLVKNSIRGNVGTLAIFDLGECIGLCKFKYKKKEKEVILLSLELRIFVSREDVLDSVSNWVLNQEGVIFLEYDSNI